MKTFGSLDVLVDNAFGRTPGLPLFEDTPDETRSRDLDLTPTGVFRCRRTALPHPVVSGRGAIVAIGSGNGFRDFGNPAHSAAKAGLLSRGGGRSPGRGDAAWITGTAVRADSGPPTANTSFESVARA